MPGQKNDLAPGHAGCRPPAFAPILIFEQPRITGGRAQLPGFRLLLARDFERRAELRFGALQFTAKLEDPSLHPERFGVDAFFLPAGPLNLHQSFLDQVQRDVVLIRQCSALCVQGLVIRDIDSESNFRPTRN